MLPKKGDIGLFLSHRGNRRVSLIVLLLFGVFYGAAV